MPTYKNPEIENLITAVSGVSRQSAEAKNICTLCHKPLTPFRDELSMREHLISGMCQSCQDDVFGDDTDCDLDDYDGEPNDEPAF